MPEEGRKRQGLVEAVKDAGQLGFCRRGRATSPYGTKRTYRPSRVMSTVEGRADAS